MAELDLDAIEARWRGAPLREAAHLIGVDIPAFVAEVVRLRADLATANTIMEAQRAHPEGEDVECSVCDHVFARDVEKVYDENATLTSQVEQLERDLAAVRFALAGRDADYDALAARLDPS